MRRALGTALLSSALLLSLLAGPAHADSLTFPDAQGDSESTSTDVITYTVSNDAAAVTVSARLAAPNVDVLTGLYEFDVNGDGISDFDAFSTGPVFRRPSFSIVCDSGATLSRPSPAVANLTVQAACLGAPSQLRVKFLLFGDAGSDFVPDAGTFSPVVTNATVAPSATPVPVPTVTAGAPAAGAQPSAPDPVASTVAPAPRPTTSAPSSQPVTPRPPAAAPPRLRLTVTPAVIRRGQQSRVCVRSSSGDTVNLYAYTSPSRSYRLVRSAPSTGSLLCWNLAPTADTRLYAGPAGEPQRNSTSAVIRVLQPARQAAARPASARPVAKPVAARPVAPAPARPSDVYHRNCAAARAAGAAPMRRGEPGYRPGLDRDNDGIACDRG